MVDSTRITIHDLSIGHLLRRGNDSLMPIRHPTDSLERTIGNSMKPAFPPLIPVNTSINLSCLDGLKREGC